MSLNLRKQLLTLLLINLPVVVLAAGKPEVVVNPNGLDPETLTAINAGISAVVRQADDQDTGEADRIRRKGREVVITALATRGYFDPEVTLEVGEDVGGETWDINIVPGELTKVNNVKNDFTGRIAHADYASQVEKFRQNWGLPQGKVFINADWSAAKSAMLASVAASDFYLARQTFSQALINPETSSADLHTVIDSGPAVTLGHTEVLGLRRVPMSLIRRYIRYQTGDRYSQSQLEDWQQALQSTSFFRGAFVSLKKPPGNDIYYEDAVQLPVQIKVTEAPARRFQGAVGIDDVNGVRVEGVYRQNVVWDYPVTLEAGGFLGLKEQRTYLDFYMPPNYDGSVDSYGMLVRHSDIQDKEVWRYGVGWRRTRSFKLDEQSRVDYESNWSLIGAVDTVKYHGVTKDRFTVPSIVGTWGLLRRDVDEKTNPRDGNLWSIDLGAGMDVQNRDPFARAALRGQLWWPIGKRDNFSIRAEVGQVFAADNTRLPDDFGYRTGGARSIRGYKYMGIGRNIGSAVVGTKSLAVMSAEYTHYFDDLLGMAVFADVGDAAESFGAMVPKAGYGAGMRVKTPAGPLFLDLAWGQRDRSIRLHFSLGIAF